jgi:hypothetical protein
MHTFESRGRGGIQVSCMVLPLYCRVDGCKQQSCKQQFKKQQRDTAAAVAPLE